MLKHHKEAIEKLTNCLRNDKRFLALIIVGSIANGTAKTNSDIDIILVATNEEFEKRKAENNCHYFANDMCSYPNGYVDGKIINLQFLLDAAERGSEPTRAAFRAAFVIYSYLPELEKILEQIPVYQKHMREKKIWSFYSQLKVLQWFMGEAEKRDDVYLLTHVAVDMVLFGGRMILAHNEILYPHHKLFMAELRNAPKKPDNIIELAKNLLTNPCKDNANLFCSSIFNFTKWDLPSEGWVTQYLKDSEWNWCIGKPSVQDL